MPITNDDRATLVVAIIAERFEIEPEKITRETNFELDLGADSLDNTELVMELEDEFDIDISDAVAEEIKTVGQAIDAVNAQFPQEASASSTVQTS